MIEIPLTQNQVALIDDEDMELVCQYKWYAFWSGRTYYAARGRKPTVFMHTLIMGRKGIDHIDMDGLNNCRSNLRFADETQNNANKKKFSGKSSMYKGVTQVGYKWRAQIQFENRHIHLGYFFEEEDAAIAYDEAAERLFGDYARTNFAGDPPVRLQAPSPRRL